jgi:RNA polymerase sigma-70 factor (ECF subfamily)
MEEKSAEQILIELQNDKEEAFRHLFNLYYLKLFNYTKGYVVSKDTARELVQEAFIKLWEVRHQLKEGTNFQAFLFTIARNSTLNYLKQLSTKRKKEADITSRDIELELNAIAMQDDASEAIIAQELEEKIDQAIALLPDKCRNIFLLSRIENLKYKEIAAQLNISVNTVENQISIALSKIKKHLGNYF